MQLTLYFIIPKQDLSLSTSFQCKERVYIEIRMKNRLRNRHLRPIFSSYSKYHGLHCHVYHNYVPYRWLCHTSIKTTVQFARTQNLPITTESACIKRLEENTVLVYQRHP